MNPIIILIFLCADPIDSVVKSCFSVVQWSMRVKLSLLEKGFQCKTLHSVRRFLPANLTLCVASLENNWTDVGARGTLSVQT